MLGHERLGALGQFGAQPVELAHLLQEGLMALDADHQRHPRGADVGGVGEDFRHAEYAMGGVESVDGELPVAQAIARVDAAGQVRVTLPVSSAMEQDLNAEAAVRT